MNQLLVQAHQFINQQNLKQAHQCCLATLQQDANNAEAHYLLALISFQLGQISKAIELAKDACRLNSRSAFYSAFLAKLYTHVHDFQSANEALQVSISLVKNDSTKAKTGNLIGVVLSRLGRHDQAVDYFQYSIKIDPKVAEAHYNLGSSARFLGDFELAETAFKNAIKLDPKYFHAYSSLADLRTATKENNRIDQIKHLLSEKLSTEQSMILAQAIYKEADHLGEGEEYFDYVIKANNARKHTVSYRFEEDKLIFNELRKAAPTIEVTQSIKSENPQPIFILGMPRSGTTLLERMVTQPRDVCACGELQEFGLLMKKYSKVKSNRILDPATIQQFDQIDFTALGKEYLERTHHYRGGSPVFVDKLPSNFFFIPYILKALPNAKIILMKRSPMDVILGNVRQLFSLKNPFFHYSLNPMDCTQFYIEFERLMNHWQQLCGDRFMQVQYEDLVMESKVEGKKVFDFIGLNWEDDYLDISKNSSAVATASSVQVRSAINTQSFGRWKKYRRYFEGAISLLEEAGLEPEIKVKQC